MGETEKKATETMEYDCKKNCYKMRNEGLRQAVALLKTTDSTKFVIDTLDTVYNLLKTYSCCLPCTLLLKRVQDTRVCIRLEEHDELFESEKAVVKILVSELKAFIANS